MSKFFIGRAVVLLVLLVIGFGYYGYKTYISKQETQNVVHTSNESVISGFAWKSEKADTLNGDGIPDTKVILEVKYADGTISPQVIDTVGGSCNEVDSKEERVNGTVVYQCYAAGLGQYFKVIIGEDSYLVQRKIFEEGSPEYTPKEQLFETIAEFPMKN